MDKNVTVYSIYEKNLQAFEDRYEADNDIYINHPDLIKHDDTKVFTGENGALCAQNAERAFYLESAYDSEKYLSAWIEKIKQNSNISSKLIMYGFGNGMFARKYIEEMADDYEMIIYEPLVSVFDYVMHSFDISDIILNTRVKLYVDGLGHEKDFTNFLSGEIKLQDVKTTIIEIYENYGLLYGDRFNDFLTSVNRCLCGVIIDTQFIAESGEFVNENIENNMTYYINSRSLLELKGKGSGIPAIVVGAGPSLDKNVDVLRKAKNRAVIIATDSAVRTLARNGLVPDVIVTMDPYKDETYLASDICEGVPLIASLHSGWRLVDGHKGPCFFTNSTDRMTNAFSIEHEIFVQSLKMGGSVAHLAFSLANHLGCEPIIFAGMDLAYPGNQSHCVDSVVASVTVEELQGDIIVKDILGNDVATSADMQRYRLWIENEIVKFPDKVYIDATEGGALINGTAILSMGETIDAYCGAEHSIAGIFDDSEDVYSSELKSELIDYISETPKHMEENLHRLDQLEPMYEKMLNMLKRGSYNTGELIDMQKKTNKILDEIEVDPLSDFTNNFVQDERNRLFSNINIINDDKIDNITETLEIGLQYVQALRKAITKGLPYAKRMVEKLPGKGV